MILPTKIEGWRGREIGHNVWLISDPTFDPKAQIWIALANVRGLLCLIEVKVSLQTTWQVSAPKLKGTQNG